MLYRPVLDAQNELTCSFRFCKEMKDEEKAALLGCEILLYEPRATLQACDAAIFKGYLHWRVKSSKGGIKKESSIMTYWNNLCMFYAREMKRYMDGGVLYDINNVSTPLLPWSAPRLT